MQKTVKQNGKARIHPALPNHRVTVFSECVAAKYAVQEKHFKQTRGNYAAYSKLLARKYLEMMNRRGAKTGVPEGFVAPQKTG